MKGVFIVFLSAILLIIGIRGSFATENEVTKITITLAKARQLTPDVLMMNIEINVSTSKETEAVNMLGELDKAIKKLGIEYSGGKYSVYKNCWWEKDRQKCSGSKGAIRYTFQLKNSNDQNNIFEVLDKYKGKYAENVDFNVSEPEWVVSDKIVQKTEDELKIEIIDNAKDFLSKIAGKLGKSCFIASIDYDVSQSFSGYGPILYKSSKSVNAPEPKKDERSVGIRAKVGLECR